MVGDDKALDVDQETGTDGGVPAVFFGRHAELGGGLARGSGGTSLRRAYLRETATWTGRRPTQISGRARWKC